jgi:hypothetical protein
MSVFETPQQEAQGGGGSTDDRVLCGNDRKGCKEHALHAARSCSKDEPASKCRSEELFDAVEGLCGGGKQTVDRAKVTNFLGGRSSHKVQDRGSVVELKGYS